MQAVIDFANEKEKRNKQFAIAAYSELMLEVAYGDVEGQAIFNILTEQGKLAVLKKMGDDGRSNTWKTQQMK